MRFRGGWRYFFNQFLPIGGPGGAGMREVKFILQFRAWGSARAGRGRGSCWCGGRCRIAAAVIAAFYSRYASFRIHGGAMNRRDQTICETERRGIYCETKMSILMEVQVATPHPKKSASSVQIGQSRARAAARIGQSSDRVCRGASALRLRSHHTHHRPQWWRVRPLPSKQLAPLPDRLQA